MARRKAKKGGKIVNVVAVVEDADQKEIDLMLEALKKGNLPLTKT